MKEQKYHGPDRREFIRLDCLSPLAVKICREETIKKLLNGYATNISEAGVLCTINNKVNKDDIIWLSFDRGTLNFCENLEKKSFIYQGGVIGKVIRTEDNNNGSYSVGIKFVTREELNQAYLYPAIRILEKSQKTNDK